MEEDPLAAILGEKEELDGDSFRAKKKNGSNGDDGTDPDILAPDLLAACKQNNVARAHDLLDDGAPPAFSDPASGWSCLHWSVYNGNPVLTRALVRAGAATRYKRASTALMQGQKASKDNTARRAPKPSLPTTDTPLHWSAYRGDLGITWILLREGYSPNDKDKMGNTAAHLAAANGHERVLDTLIRDGADVHQQNKFKNTPYDVANSTECRNILKRAEALPPPSVEDAEEMHHENLQRILEVERVLIEAVGSLEPTNDENRRRKRQMHEGGYARPGEDEKAIDDDEEDDGGFRRKAGAEEKGEMAGAADGKGVIVQGGRGSQGEKVVRVGGDGSRSKGDGDVSNQHSNHLMGEEKGDGYGTSGREGKAENGQRGSSAAALDKSAAQTENADSDAPGENAGKDDVEGGALANGQHSVNGWPDGIDAGDPGVDGREGDGEAGEKVLAQVERLRDAVAGAEALCICEDLVAAARLRIDGLLLQHSIEEQAARVNAEGPILTQYAYTTLVNRLMLLLRRAEGNQRISGKLKRKAKVLVDKSHGEYWLQVSAKRLLKVECAEARHVPEMVKLEACIEKAANVGAQPQLVHDCRSLLKRLTTEVEISNAITGFPTVRLPIDPLPKDYWQPEDTGHIEETEEFPLPPVDADGKSLDYVWVPSKSLRALSAACKRMSEALVGGEGLNPALVERGGKKLQEHQKELKVLTEKDTADKDKAVAIAAKAAKKKKKKGGGGKKKKK